MDRQTRRTLRNPFVWGFWLLGAVACLIVLSGFLTSWGKSFWMRVAQWGSGPLDAPDNWAMAITYCLKTAMVVGGIGVASAVVGLVQLLKGRHEEGG
jgi:hypothetical protein